MCEAYHYSVYNLIYDAKCVGITTCMLEQAPPKMSQQGVAHMFANGLTLRRVQVLHIATGGSIAVLTTTADSIAVLMDAVYTSKYNVASVGNMKSRMPASEASRLSMWQQISSRHHYHCYLK